jgi:para-aminobenzoate synthetase/4-amino-4-deoxychorismate lyase
MEFPITAILGLLQKEDNCVFLESANCNKENRLSYLFLRPAEVISTCSINKVEDCLTRLNKALDQGYYAAGFLAYEAGEAFEERLRSRRGSDFPLLWFGVYREPLIYNHRKAGFEDGNWKEIASSVASLLPRNDGKRAFACNDAIVKNIRPNISQNTYLKAISRIKHLIEQGLTYQVNYTFKLKFNFSGSASDLYLNLRSNQPVSYSSFIKTDKSYLLSFSPELFFRKTVRTILTRPMKGTARRGKDLKEDSEIAGQLINCPKNRSENLMIVDMLRNDLGRISATGSIKVSSLFNIEKYQTLFQMTSDIKGRLKRSHSGFDIFRYIFPSGSVTGAPKIKTMQIVRQLEKEPRGVYTGSIGFFSPEKTGVFNVAIRTLLIDRRTKRGEMGVGSGIVYDSDPKGEYAECCLKADFLTKRTEPFQLIETMLWRPGKGYLLLTAHLKRLGDSARYLGFVCKRGDILKTLMKLKDSFRRNNYRVRLLLFKNGKIKLESSVFQADTAKEPKVCLSARKMRSANPLLYHKTTSRKIYDREYNRCKDRGFYDIIFTNEKGEVTEGTISNIFVRKNGTLYTPPVSCGLLDGVYRKYMFSSGKFPVQERILFKKDLLNADEFYLSNSVRGLVRVYFAGENH